MTKKLGVLPVSDVNMSAGKVQEKITISLLPRKKVAPFLKKRLLPSEKITPSEDFEKGTNSLKYMEEPVHKIRIKDLDNFKGNSTESTGWFNLDH